MAKKESKLQLIFERLRDEKKVSSFDSQEDMEAVAAINERMEAVRRDYQVKERNSQISAASVILNA